MFFRKQKMGTGAIPRPYDPRDKIYDELVAGAPSMTEEDWKKGFDIEKELNFKLPIKNQNSSSSCVSQCWSYYVGVLNLVETKRYEEISAKAIYSQIHLPNGGAYIMDGGKLIVNWGSLEETYVPSYENGNPPSEKFMRDLSWKNPAMDKLAKILEAKEYRRIDAKDNMDLFAMAIKNNYGVVGGLYVGNSKTWRTNEPKPSTREGGHCLYYGKFGIDEKGKYIATPNSWGERPKDALHPDGWQKLRQDYFQDIFQFDPWLLVDKPNVSGLSPEAQKVLIKNEKKIIIEGEGAGRKGIVVNGKLLNITKGREADACLYELANNGYGQTISTKLFNELYNIDNNF